MTMELEKRRKLAEATVNDFFFQFSKKKREREREQNEVTEFRLSLSLSFSLSPNLFTSCVETVL